MNLNERFKKFADLEYESIDDAYDIQFKGQKADYFTFDRSWILEVKFLETDRSPNINDYINKQVDIDPDFPKFYGTVHIEELIQKHKNTDFIRNQLFNYAARNLKAICSKADKQIAETKNALKNPLCIGILVVLNERNDFHDQNFIYQEISRLLHKKNPEGDFERKNIHAVWYIHEYQNNKSKYAISDFLIRPTDEYESIRSLANLLHLDWISYNGYAFIPSDLK
ncbi:hypothetical protein [Acinetobacter pecorum]